MRKIKHTVITSLLFLSANLFAQNNIVKGNVIPAVVGIVNVGIEHKLSDHYSIQTDITISPWKSFSGHPLQAGLIILEGRYYFKEALNKWYVGFNGGFATYKLAKWNYWDSDKYQKGMNYMFGGVVGYQAKLSEKWTLDAFLGGGWTQGFYKGYDKSTGERYDHAEHWNKSGEWIPYRGGVMIGYKF